MRSAHDVKPFQSSAMRCDDDDFEQAATKEAKPLCIADLDEEVHLSATDCENSGGGIRTHDTRIMILLL